MRTILESPARFTGVGLHGGQAARVTVHPAAPGTGILFRRTDMPAGDIPARYDHVADARLCTRLANAHGASVGTVEHLMAALAGLGIGDALVLIDGPEVPIMDGSARAFVRGLIQAGLREQGGTTPAIRILEPVEVTDGGKRARLEPSPVFSLAFRIDFDDPAIGRQELALELTGERFVEELADCRTFGHLEDVERLRAAGLGRGGSLDNAIVVHRGRVLNPGGLRRADEFVRHKMLDAVGDLALAGAPILGRYVAERAGHELTNRLLRALFARRGAWCWTRARAEALPGAAVGLPEIGETAAALAV